jgi:diguanylate cyclase (GGDEF)-like protein
VGVQRDQAADQRDEAADERDRVADVRDQVADAREQTGGMPGVPIGERITAEAVRRSEVAQPGAAFDRKNASQDRGAAASDRDTALEDRGFGANERTHAKQDRRTAAADRRASAEERHAASLDGLTGVYNRTAGLMELEREIARARRIKQALVLAFLDVDHLKAINDSGGHPAGDRVLVEVAETVKLQVRPYDLIMRYGGDEFICAFPGLTATDVTRRLALVNAVLAEAPVQASITAGITTLRSHDTANDLIARADARLYRERQKAAAGSSSASH